MLRMVTCSALLLTACSAPGASDSEPYAARSLFNGRDLDGWVRVNTAPDTWTVEDGLLRCSGRPTGQLRTDRMYQNFVLELEWRHLDPGGNAGVFVWADDITARGVPFQRGIEVQVLDHGYGNTEHYTTHGDIFPIHGASMVPFNGRGGSRAFPTELRSNPSPEWNHYSITCVDGAIALAVNGKEVTRGASASPRRGYICLESEGGRVDYRNLRLTELPGGPLPSGEVAIADRGYRSLYTGIDLEGWRGDARRWSARDWILNHSSEAEHSSLLVSDSLYGDFGFVADVRLGEGGRASLLLRGDPAAAVDLGALAPVLEEGWNRLEGQLAGDRLSLLVNGRSVLRDERLEGAPREGPLVLEAAGTVEFASLFVRDL